MATINEPPVRAAATSLMRARRGDRKAFSRLTEPYRRELIAYCYRLTGTLTEAEDMVQEAFLRAFRALETFEGRASLRAWLYKIAHNLCLNHVQRRPPGWESLDEVGEINLASDAEDAGQGRENVRLGFVALVQSLPPRQRAALVLRDVLGWSAEETARILETTVPAVKNALGRARQTLARHPSGGDPADVRDLAASDPDAREIVAQWVDAFEKGNTVRMVELLTGEWTPQTGYNRNSEYKSRDARVYGEKARKEREERTHGERQRA
ncbi:MAG: sigma-70 family RNA polymerase sigma factor [Janthinobacterium lividum]